MLQKMASVLIDVPYRGTGNIILHKKVYFDVFKEDDCYKAVPELELDERRLANLPPELNFEYKDGRALSRRGNKDGNLEIIKDIAEIMKSENLL